jgi:hypothetical protein
MGGGGVGLSICAWPGSVHPEAKSNTPMPAKKVRILPVLIERVLRGGMPISGAPLLASPVRVRSFGAYLISPPAGSIAGGCHVYKFATTMRNPKVLNSGQPRRVRACGWVTFSTPTCCGAVVRNWPIAGKKVPDSISAAGEC